MAMMFNREIKYVLVFLVSLFVSEIRSMQDDASPSQSALSREEKQQILRKALVSYQEIKSMYREIFSKAWVLDESLQNYTEPIRAGQVRLSQLKIWLLARNNKNYKGLKRFCGVLITQKQLLEDFVEHQPLGYGRKQHDYLPTKWTLRHERKKEEREARAAVLRHVLSSLEDIDGLMGLVVEVDSKKQLERIAGRRH